MLSSLTQISLLRPPLESISSRKYSQKPRIKLIENNKMRLVRKYCMRPSYRKTVSLIRVQSTSKVECDDNNGGGIGIHKFFHGKNIFLTGATGLLGKVLLEKLLRSTSVGKIYVLIKANDKEASQHRLSEEIIDSELFECIREKQGKKFVESKLIPVVGNICEANMGMDSYSANAIMEEVDVIIASAANTEFYGRYDMILDANVNGPQRLLRFAKRCKNLKLFVHFSTVYVNNGKREEMIYETPLTFGEHGRRCNHDDEASLSLFQWLDLSYEMNLAMKSCIDSTNNQDATKVLKKLGQERSEYYGWSNQYRMSKALGEMVINEMREDVPVLIIRPSIVEGCYKEPLPGWIQGNRMFDPVIISYGKGQLPAYLANPRAVMDFIPVDIVANTTIAAIAKHANQQNSRQINVYHVASGDTNPLLHSEVFEYLYEYFKESPLVDSKRISRVKFFDNFNDFKNYTREELFRRNMIDGQDETMTSKIRRKCNAIATYNAQMGKIYEFEGFFNATFHTGNNQKLLEKMSKKEQFEFDVDVRNVDWKKYFQEIHIEGVKKYLMHRA